MSERQPSARSEAMEWMRDEIAVQIANNKMYSAAQVARAAADHFAANPDWCARYLERGLIDFAYRCCGAVAAESRRMGVADYRQYGDKFAPAGTLGGVTLDPPELSRSAFERFLENVADGENKPLLLCTREELEAAATRRFGRMRKELKHITLLRTLAERLSPGEVLGDRMTVEEVAQEWSQLEDIEIEALERLQPAPLGV